MAGIKGRSVVIRRNGVNVAGARTKNISINKSSIDITNDDDDGIRKLLDEPGQVDVEISVSGILLTDTLASEALSSSDGVKNTQFIRGGFEQSPQNTKGFIGDFFMSSYTEGAEYQGAVTFEATFQSAGPVTFTS